MKKAIAIAYRQLTAADFFHTSKPQGHDQGGGGQSYIDLAGSQIPLKNWQSFFDLAPPVSPAMRGGPAWDLNVYSLGLSSAQTVRIATRTNVLGKIRNIGIRSQKLHSNEANRVLAWNPNFTSFPDLPTGVSSSNDPQLETIVDGLYVFIIRTADDQYWAGYLNLADTTNKLAPLFTDKEGLIQLSTPIDFDETLTLPNFGSANAGEAQPAFIPANLDFGFSTKAKTPESKETKVKPKKEASFTDLLFEDDLQSQEPELKKITSMVRKRNKRAVAILKELYKTCQITGEKYSFKKHDGDPYLEAHHLIPLGVGGADHPANLVVISAHVHRMLHYAKVSDIDLSKIKDNKLPISINGQPYEIVWKPEHVDLINKIKVSEEEDLASSEGE